MSGTGGVPPNPEPTVDEIIALLRKTALPTVVVEGSDDMIIYRRLEESLGHLGVSVLAAGGRDNVLSIFGRREEIPVAVNVAFVADQDTWIYTGIPIEYRNSRLVVTAGYSIENDVFQDGNLLSLLVGAEKSRFLTELQHFVEWYSLALSRHLIDRSHAISLHPDHVLNPAQRATLLSLNAGEPYPVALRQRIHADYVSLVRGKSLMALFLRNTNSRGRPHARHSDTSLLEMVAVRPGPLLQRVTRAVESIVSA